MKLRLILLLVGGGFLLAGCGHVSPVRIEKAAARSAERRAASAMARDLVRDNASLITFGDITPLLPAGAIALLTVSVNFVVKVHYASAPILISIKK